VTDAKPIRPPRRRLRRALWGVALLLALGAAAHGLAWRWATGALAVGFSDWATQRRAEGWDVSHAPPSRAGWPLAARLAVPDLVISAPARGGQVGFAHSAARVVLELAPVRPDHLAILLEGPQLLALGDMRVPFAAERFAITVPLAPGPAAAEASVARLQALLPEGPMTLHSAEARLQPARVDADPTAALVLAIERIVLPPSPAAAALGAAIESLAAEALMLGALPPRGPPALAAAAWRDAGGSLDLRRVSLRWGPLAAEARMSLGLDAVLQPAGTGTLRVSGAAEAAEALARAGLIAPGAARTAQGMAALLARVPPEGGPPRIEVPVALAQGTLSLARLPLFRVTPIAWPPVR
jgi:hypothetical protein